MAKKKKDEEAIAEAEAPVEGSEDGEKKKGGKKKKIIIIVAVLFVLFVFKTMFLGGKAKEVTQEQCTTTTTLEPLHPIALVGLDPVTLSVGSRYLKVDIAVQLVTRVPCPDDHIPAFAGGGGHAEFSADEFKSGEGQIARDAVRRVLQEKTVEELQTSHGREEAVKEIKEEVIHAYHEWVNEVYIGDFYWQ